MSAKEERDLKLLLDRFAFEVGDIDEFQQRLQAELAALEVCSNWANAVVLATRTHQRQGLQRASSDGHSLVIAKS